MRNDCAFYYSGKHNNVNYLTKKHYLKIILLLQYHESYKTYRENNSGYYNIMIHTMDRG